MSKLQEEIKKKLPFDSLEHEAILNLIRTTDQFEILFSRLFREYALTNSQYNALRILRGEGKPLPILEIASRMLVVVPGITGLIDRLEEAGWVKRARCENDRRVIYVAATEKTIEVLEKMDEAVTNLHKKLVGHLSSAELQELIRLLEKARESVEKKEAP